MKIYNFLLSAILVASFSNLFSQERFATKVMNTELLTNETEICYYIDNKLIGFISFTKVPLFKFYAIHSFYIYPKYRNNGYGKKLLAYSCNFLKKIGAKRIYIQPGPFEIMHGKSKNITDETRQLRIQKLIKLYKEVEFNFVNSLSAGCAHFLYRIMGIEENSKYLMVNTKT